jgi:cytochrome c peroxidase
LGSFAASAPYFHDGSAATLEALLRERGAVHGMATSTQLTDTQIADLTAFLETLWVYSKATTVILVSPT